MATITRWARPLILLGVGLAIVTLLVAWTEVRGEQRALRDEVQRHAEALADRLRGFLEAQLRHGSVDQLPAIVEQLSSREQLAGLAVYDAGGTRLAVSSALAASLGNNPPAGRTDCGLQGRACGEFVPSNVGSLYAYSVPLQGEWEPAGRLTTYQDASPRSSMPAQIWRAAVSTVVPQVLLIVIVLGLVIESTILRPIGSIASWLKDLRIGRATTPPGHAHNGFLKPISSEIAGLAHSLAAARVAAEGEARLREAADSVWTQERLAVAMRDRLLGSRLFVVSNREPYEHVRRGRGIEAIVPASGLVTAIEPVLCACDGTWIAHGSGNADQEATDRGSRLRVPPTQPRYTLRRVWLTKAEEEGYYFGFANEGLWPLCHIAHTRPLFRADDWAHYQRVNQKFAKAVLEEMRNEDEPFLLIQDYHLALLPRLIKEQRPDARVALFWHIPWPNPEAFGICPWQQELLDGLLGADLIGFHIQAHCDNFLETVDRSLECRVEWERFAVSRRQHSTIVRPHPISVALPDQPKASSGVFAPLQEPAATRRALGVNGGFLGVGVDRIDYTKGIVERFRAIERFLEKYASYRGRFTFLQIGAPSRINIARYRDLVVEVEAEADRINRRFEDDRWKPIMLITKQHSHQEIAPLYRAADLCLVTSLHDGMNLVAKEFVASRDDEGGVLVLSQFAGASRELRDAVMINPYDVEQMADAIRTALEMSLDERRVRMRRMRRTVRNRNVYRWAADLISELAEVCPEPVEVSAAQ
jgi:trehalose 6-phosphate synthase